jgi:hypothetical protein
MMISVIKTSSGGYNILGTADGVFVIQGHLTKEQLKELRTEINKELKK